jgi:hypothetical protein
LAGATGAAGVACVLHDALQQHLHIQRFNNQPSNVPARNHQKQHPKELKSELIFTPQ